MTVNNHKRSRAYHAVTPEREALITALATYIAALEPLGHGPASEAESVHAVIYHLTKKGWFPNVEFTLEEWNEMARLEDDDTRPENV